MPQTEVHLELDAALVAEARARGPLDAVVGRALRQSLHADEIARLQRWAEDNALLVEALAGGAEEMALRRPA